MAKVALCRSFLESYSNLPLNIQKQTREKLDLIILDSKSPGLHIENINNPKDRRMRSARINLEYRMILLQPEIGDYYYLIWADHHDEAYQWAQNHVISGKMLDGSLSVAEARPIIITERRLFKDYTDAELFTIGVPDAFLPVVRQIEEEYQLDDLRAFMPAALYEDLYNLCRGGYSAEDIKAPRDEERRLAVERLRERMEKGETDGVISFVEPLSQGQIIRQKYVVEALVGIDRREGRSAVYKVRDIDNPYMGNRAVKVFMKQDERTERVIHNELMVRQNAVHENISRCFGLDRLDDTGEPFLMLEYHEGCILKDWPMWAAGQKNDNHRLAAIAAMLRQLLSGLNHLHCGNIVHGNMSSYSVVLDQHNVVKIVSFDNSGSILDKRPLPAAISRVSPPDLMEQGWHLGQDTYAVGAMLFEAITGQMLDKVNPQIPRDVEAQIGRKWSRFIEMAICPQLTGRFNNAGEMLTALNRM